MMKALYHFLPAKKINMFLKKPDSDNFKIDEDPRSLFSRFSVKSDDLAGIYKKKYDEGYNKGKEEGTAEGKSSAEIALKEEYNKAFENIASSVKKLDLLYDNYLTMINSLEEGLPDLIAAVSESLIHDKFDKDDGTIIKDTIQEIVRKLNSKFVVYVSEDDKEKISLPKSFDVKSDKELKVGDIVIDWKFGKIDGRIKTRIRNIEDQIRGIKLEEFIKNN